MAAPLRTSQGSPDDRQTITCLYCGKPQEVARRAMSVTCKFCHKSLKLEDITIKQYEARRQVATCGVVTVEKKGSAVTDTIKCGGLIVRGKVKGTVEAHGPVLIGPEAEVKGDVSAPTLAVGAGAVLEGQYQIGPKEGEGGTPAELPDASSPTTPTADDKPAPPPKPTVAKPTVAKPTPQPPAAKKPPPPPPTWAPGKLAPPFKR